MAASEFHGHEPHFAPSQSRPMPSRSHVNPTASGYALSDEQNDILALLEGRAAPAVVADAAPKSGWGMDLAFGTMGATAIVSGMVMVFFFAALGSVLLVLGAIMCAVAFEHVALADLRAEEAASAAAEPVGHVLGATALPER